MPVRIILVHDDRTFLEDLAAALEKAGHDVTMFDNSTSAWDALRAAEDVDVLITRIQFGPGKPHGVALAQWARMSCPRARVLFTARPEFEPYAEGIGAFLSMPAETSKVVEIVARFSASDQVMWDHHPFTKPN